MVRSTVEDLKSLAGREAAAGVASGMRLGLGSGSTAACFLEHLGARLASGELTDVVCVPTSIGTEKDARRLGIPLGTLGELAPLDLTVDGADEVDPHLNLIKGLGGALLREKMVAQASARFVVIVDEAKLVGRLGERTPLPLEVVPFEFDSHRKWLEALGADPEPRRNGNGDIYLTDNRLMIIDCRFVNGIDDPEELDRR
ncbi:MAG: ribose-5-phosphate isomerase RpiA, partial [Gemmatimonadetes bacterium]|nr:ribose-5-phosphate isomerase RpiA [Gemmatimonadota bacterium]